MGGIDRFLVVGIAASLGAIGFLLLRRSPRLALVAWLTVLALVPYWIGVNVVTYLPATSLVAALAAAALYSSRSSRVGLVDVLLLTIVALYVVSFLIDEATLGAGFTLVVHWAAGYLLGRVIGTSVDLEWIHGAVAVAMTAAAVLALEEFLTGQNLLAFLKMDNSAYTIWGDVQIRGGLARSEGAFGHSIALGASLAMALPLAIASTFRPWIRGAMVVTILAATVVTFSRTGMICAVFSLVLCVFFLRGYLTLRARVALVVGSLAVAAVAVPFLLATFAEAGDEATDSSSYRGDLLSLVPTMSILGEAESAYRTPTGDTLYGSFHSIDSALILLGLTLGLVPLAIVVTLLVAAIGFVVSGRATASTIAVVGQIPALATVALITQYSTFFWFIAGLAVVSQSRAATRASRADASREAVPGLVAPAPVDSAAGGTDHSGAPGPAWPGRRPSTVSARYEEKAPPWRNATTWC